MNAPIAALDHAAIRQHCKHLRLPSIAAQFDKLEQEAVKQRRTHAAYLARLLSAEVEDREQRVIERRLQEAHLPRMKTLAEFDFGKAAQISATQIQGKALGRLSWPRRTGDSHRRMRHRQNPFGHRLMRRGLWAEAACALHHGRRPGQ